MFETLLRDDRGTPRSLVAYWVLAVAAWTFASLSGAHLPVSGAPTVIVPAAVFAVAVGVLLLGVALSHLWVVCAVLIALLSGTPVAASPPRECRLPPSDPCRRVISVLLAGPRAPGARAA